MAVVHGKNGKVKLGSNTVAEVTKWSTSPTVPEADTTAMGDSWGTHVTGVPVWTGTIEGHYDVSDTTGQGALTIGASVTVEFYTDGDGSGKTYQTGTASVVRVNREATVTDRVTFSIEVRGNGELAEATVT